MTVEPDMPGSPAANQSKTESIPPTQGHPQPAAGAGPTAPDAPDLAEMSVGAADPQAPSHPAAGDRGDRANAGVPAVGEAGTPAGRSARAGRPGGENALEPATEGVAFRQPGSLGATGRGEQVDTNVERSAEQTGPAGGPAAGDLAPGTSETAPIRQGARTPL